MSNERGNAVRFSICGFGLCLSRLLPFLESFLFLRGAFGKFFGSELFVLVVCGCVWCRSVWFLLVVWVHWNGFFSRKLLNNSLFVRSCFWVRSLLRFCRRRCSRLSCFFFFSLSLSLFPSPLPLFSAFLKKERSDQANRSHAHPRTFLLVCFFLFLSLLPFFFPPVSAVRPFGVFGVRFLAHGFWDFLDLL